MTDAWDGEAAIREWVPVVNDVVGGWTVLAVLPGAAPPESLAVAPPGRLIVADTTTRYLAERICVLHNLDRFGAPGGPSHGKPIDS